MNHISKYKQFYDVGNQFAFHEGVNKIDIPVHESILTSLSNSGESRNFFLATLEILTKSVMLLNNSGEASPIFSHAMQIFLRSKTVKTMNFLRNE